MVIRSFIPHRPVVSDILIKASANVNFRSELLTDARAALAPLNLPPEDLNLLVDIQANTLSDYARQVKKRLLMQPTYPP